MAFDKEFSALHPPERKIWPVHSGEFSKLGEGVPGLKNLFQRLPFIFRNMAFRKKFPAVRPPEAKIWPNAPLCTVGNFQTKIMPQWKNFLLRPPFIFQNMTFEKEIGAV